MLWPTSASMPLEIDLFIQNDYEESDLNHGLTLLEARKISTLWCGITTFESVL